MNLGELQILTNWNIEIKNSENLLLYYYFT